MPRKTKLAAPTPPPGRVRRITLGGWDALGTSRPLAIDLDGQQIAFFGRNGVGKSALFEGLFWGLKAPLFHRRRFFRDAPKAFEIEIEAPELEGGALHYRYHWDDLSPTASRETGDVDSAVGRLWSETCWASIRRRPLWSVRNGKVKLGKSESSITLPKDSSLLLAFGSELRATPIPELERILALCKRSLRVPPGVPREGRDREEVYIRVREIGSDRVYSPVSAPLNPPRVSVVQFTLLRWHDEHGANFEEFQTIGQRLRLFESLTVETYRPANGNGDVLAAVFVDGINMGLLSDGTLRMMEILVQLLLTPPGALLLIEEPETGVHPGLLAGLLNELDAYSQDRQILFSTHSPLVVSHVKPSDLRLVEREKGKTTVRKLSGSEARRASAYLEDQGTLGEFVFDGGI